LPLAPEPIANTDGQRNQDCELSAAKRFLAKIRSTLAPSNSLNTVQRKLLLGNNIC
jgi:hypothetical protein